MEAKDLIPINATMIVGILVFYTIPLIVKGSSSSKDGNRVFYSTAVAISLFAVSAIISMVAASAIMATVSSTPLFVAEILTILGFAVIAVATFFLTKVISAARISTLLKNTLQVLFWASKQYGTKKDDNSVQDLPI